MGYLVVGSLIMAAVVHLAPLAGVLGSPALESLYGVSVIQPDLLILMRHRAVLFGLIGGLMIAATAVPRWRDLAFVAGLINVVSFVCIAWTVGHYNHQLGRVVTIDLVTLFPLLVGWATHRYLIKQGSQ